MLKKITTLSLIILFSLTAASCKQGKTAIEIDGDKITIDEFLNYYYVQNGMLLNMTKKQITEIPEMVKANHQTLNKDRFMQFILSRKLLLTTALADKDVDQKELQSVIDLYKLQGVATFYLMKKLKGDIKVSEKEIEAVYNKYRKQFRGVPINQAEEKIKQQVFMQKCEQASAQFVQKLIAESKIKRSGFDEYLKGLTKKPVAPVKTAPTMKAIPTKTTK